MRWIGTWSGDPASGAVMFRMTAEGDDVAHLELDLSEAAGFTALTFAQRLHDPALAKDVGPGWEYYLDRLVAVQAGADVAAVAWPDYEGMSAYDEPLFTDPS